MRRALTGALAGALVLTGCAAYRPWTTEESCRIDAIVESREDPADVAAAQGIPTPSGLSPSGVLGYGVLASAEPSLGKRKKKGGGKGTKTDPFSRPSPEAKPKKAKKAKGAKR